MDDSEAATASAESAGMETSEAAAGTALGTAMQSLLEAYTAIDKTILFLSKRHLTCVASSILPMAGVSTDTLRQLLSLVPRVLVLRAQLPPADTAGAAQAAAEPLRFYHMELQPAGATSVLVAKRKRLVDAAITQYVLEAHATFCSSRGLAIPTSSGRKRKKDATSWHPDFDPNRHMPDVPMASLPELTLPSGVLTAASGASAGSAERPASPPPAASSSSSSMAHTPAVTMSPGSSRSVSTALANVAGRGGGRVGSYVPAAVASRATATELELLDSSVAAIAKLDIESFLKSLPQYVGQIKHKEVRSSQAATYADPVKPLHPCVREALRAQGISKLYRHQSKAVDAANDGQHVVISTSTASGKSLVFLLPVLHRICRQADAVALVIFPTKALAQDQLRAIVQLCSGSPYLASAVKVATLDGDTPQAQRDAVCARANIILTNPDILHASLLPSHRHWHRVLSCLSFIVVDESHTYTGVFGSHVALVMRRLLRLCARYQGQAQLVPQVICCSATIGNAVDHFRALFSPFVASRRVCHIGAEENGAAVGERRYLLWDPPVLQETVSSTVVSDSSAPLADVSSDAPEDGPMSAADAHEIELASILSINGADVEAEGGGAGAAASADMPAVRPAKRRKLAGSATPSPDTHSAATMDSLAEPSVDAVGSLLVRPTPWMAPKHDKDYERKADDARFSMPSLRNPFRYRHDSRSAPFGMVAEGQKVPRWVERFREQHDADTPRKRSAIVETAILLSALVQAGLRTIVFCRTRKVSELVLQYTHERLALADTAFQARSAGAASAAAERPLVLVGKVKAYRAGYLKENRRAIEAEMFSGKLLAIVATNALELGIDVGCLDVALLLGFPGSAASFWQQSGRVGRAGKAGCTILVTYDSPVDQFMIREPTSLFERPAEAAIVDPQNPLLLRLHAMCAAAEAPLVPWDAIHIFGNLLGSSVAKLRLESALVQADAGRSPVGLDLWPKFTHDDPLPEGAATSASAHSTTIGSAELHAGPPASPVHLGDPQLDAAAWQEAASALESWLIEQGTWEADEVKRTPETRHNDAGSSAATPTSRLEIGPMRAWKLASWVERPSSQFSLRCTSEEHYTVLDADSGAPLAVVEEEKAYYVLHPSAMFLLNGSTYKIVHMDSGKKLAYGRLSNEQYYTSLRDLKNVNSLSRQRSSQAGRTHVGRVQVIVEAFGYNKIHKRSGMIFETVDLSLPPHEFVTSAMWADIPLSVKHELDRDGLDFLGGQHAAAHAVMAVLPRHVLCDRADLGTECCSPYQTRARPLRTIVYDAVPGGSGIAQAAFDKAASIFQDALDLVRQCPCDDGCPACLYDLACSEFNIVLDKRAAIKILTAAVEDVTAAAPAPAVAASE